MSNILQQGLNAAVLRLMRPLVRILLRNGVSYGAFSDLAKWVYVDVATKDFDIAGRKQSVSRVSVLTGLNRKEVSKQQAMLQPEDDEQGRQYNRAARVISGWISDQNYLSRDNEAAVLPFDGDEVSFSTLVKEHSGDIPARAILDELLRVGAVSVLEDNRIQLKTHAYIPQTGEEEKLHILGTDVADLIATIDHNLSGKESPRFQRKVAYDNLPLECLPQLQQMTAEKGQKLLEGLNEWLQTQDRDSNPAVNGTGKTRAGVAVYYFQQNDEEGEPS